MTFATRKCEKCGRLFLDQIEEKKCVQCGRIFKPRRPFQICCGPVCAGLRQKDQDKVRRMARLTGGTAHRRERAATKGIDKSNRCNSRPMRPPPGPREPTTPDRLYPSSASVGSIITFSNNAHTAKAEHLFVDSHIYATSLGARRLSYACSSWGVPP